MVEFIFSGLSNFEFLSHLVAVFLLDFNGDRYHAWKKLTTLNVHENNTCGCLDADIWRHTVCVFSSSTDFCRFFDGTLPPPAAAQQELNMIKKPNEWK